MKIKTLKKSGVSFPERRKQDLFLKKKETEFHFQPRNKVVDEWLKWQILINNNTNTQALECWDHFNLSPKRLRSSLTGGIFIPFWIVCLSPLHLTPIEDKLNGTEQMINQITTEKERDRERVWPVLVDFTLYLYPVETAF